MMDGDAILNTCTCIYRYQLDTCKFLPKYLQLNCLLEGNLSCNIFLDHLTCLRCDLCRDPDDQNM